MIYTPYGSPSCVPENLEETFFLDFNVETVKHFVEEALQGEKDKTLSIVKLFYAVRDKIRYSPYEISLSPEFYKASYLLGTGEGYCVQKACLLTACARLIGVPAVIGTSDVVNHLSVPKLKKMMEGREVFMHHAYAVMYIEHKWIKAVPAFNLELCERLNVLPTEFDGKSDALLQEYDTSEHKSMSYLKDHGVWSDLPLERIAADFRAYYPSDFIVNT